MLGLSWDHILVLIAAALFILGPERLPGAAAWLGRTVRQARGMAQRAQQQMRYELGPEFDELRKPLEDLRQLRSFDPRRAITQHLFDGDPDPLGLTAADGHRPAEAAPRPDRRGPAERPPVDPDAT